MILLLRTFLQPVRHHIPARRNNASIPGTNHSLNFKKGIGSCPGCAEELRKIRRILSFRLLRIFFAGRFWEIWSASMGI